MDADGSCIRSDDVREPCGYLGRRMDQMMIHEGHEQQLAGPAHLGNVALCNKGVCLLHGDTENLHCSPYRTCGGCPLRGLVVWPSPLPLMVYGLGPGCMMLAWSRTRCAPGVGTNVRFLTIENRESTSLEVI